jgi:hypothetical protein
MLDNRQNSLKIVILYICFCGATLIRGNYGKLC